MKRFLVALALVAGALAAPTDLQAQEAAFDPGVEMEARDVGKSLRCVVCQNQSIEDSSAPLAADMRLLVRERLAAGDTPDQVRSYMTERYGNFVLMKPPFQADTLLLWLGPIGFVALAAAGWLAYVRPRARASVAPSPLSAEEEAALARRLAEETGT